MLAADWSVVGLGVLLIMLTVLLVRMSPRGSGPAFERLRTRFGAIPALLGSMMILSNLPRLLGAPHVVVMFFDTVGVVPVVIGFILVALTLRRSSGH